MTPKNIIEEKINTTLRDKTFRKDKVINVSKMKEKVIRIVPDREPDKGIDTTIESIDINKKKLEAILVNDFPCLL
jgi:hypothetical protein